MGTVLIDRGLIGHVVSTGLNSKHCFDLSIY
jgi:hypothetical protein